MKNISLASILLLVVLNCTSLTNATERDSIKNNSIDYLGQTLPGDSAIIFAPGIISMTDRLEGKIAFSPDGNECYFTVWGQKYSSCKIFCTKLVNNNWTEQVEAPFSVGNYCGEPFVSADGKKLYFDYSSKEKGTDIWMVQRTLKGWSEPQVLPSPVNSDKWDANYSESTKGTPLFSSNRTGGLDARGDMWCIRKSLEQPVQAENLGATVNSTSWDAGTIAPDESCIIFTSERPGGHGHSDLYVSFKKEDGGWTEPVNMEKNGSGINIDNTFAVETDPSFSPDGCFLFFTRRIVSATGEQSDVYWISTKIINDIKKQVFTLRIEK